MCGSSPCSRYVCNRTASLQCELACAASDGSHGYSSCRSRREGTCKVARPCGHAHAPPTCMVCCIACHSLQRDKGTGVDGLRPRDRSGLNRTAQSRPRLAPRTWLVKESSLLLLYMCENRNRPISTLDVKRKGSVLPSRAPRNFKTALRLSAHVKHVGQKALDYKTPVHWL